MHTILTAHENEREPTPAQRELTDRLALSGLLIPPPPEPATELDRIVAIPARSAPEPIRLILAALQPQPNLTIPRHQSPRGPAAARNSGATTAVTSRLESSGALDQGPEPANAARGQRGRIRCELSMVMTHDPPGRILGALLLRTVRGLPRR